MVVVELKNHHAELQRSVTRMSLSGRVSNLINGLPHRKNVRFFHAVKLGNYDSVETLLGEGVDVHLADNEKLTAILHAIRNGDQKMLQLLVAHGADASMPIQTRSVSTDVTRQVSYHLTTPLIEAVAMDSHELVKEVLHAGVDCNARVSHGKTALMHARSSDVVSMLIDAGSDLEATDFDGKTPIMSVDTAAAVRSLIKAGGNLNAKDNSGHGVLFLQMHKTWLVSWLAHYWAPDFFLPYSEIPEMLLASGADWQELMGLEFPISQYNWISEFQLLAHANDEELLQALFDQNCDVNSQDRNGITPLILAANWKNEAAVLRLVQLGANVNHQGVHEVTALMVAVSKNSMPCVKHLLDAGASSVARSENGMDSRDIAEAELSTAEERLRQYHWRVNDQGDSPERAKEMSLYDEEAHEQAKLIAGLLVK